MKPIQQNGKFTQTLPVLVCLCSTYEAQKIDLLV
jgi:hypothetical protein